MKEFIKRRTIGFYFLFIAGVLEFVSLIRFLLWAPRHEAMDVWIAAALAAGIVLSIFVVKRDNEYLMIIITAMYSIPAVKLLTNSVGSFVDAFQGINMFGDSTQVGTIISISIGMGIGVLLCIISGFLKRQKEL